MRRFLPLTAIFALTAAPAMADELGGSRASVRHQHEIAKDNDFTFLRTPAQVREFVAEDRLEKVEPNADLAVSKVSFPYTRPILKTFIERLAAQYRAATGEQLVVTSLVRPKSQQPRNASPLSVHPAGMAVDLRVPAVAAHRAWLERTLISLEGLGVLDATRERHPPHYHVAVFPARYGEYVAPLIARDAAAAAGRSLQAAALAIPRAIQPTAGSEWELPFALALIAAALVAAAPMTLAVQHARRQR